jgi:hypothetical protein
LVPEGLSLHCLFPTAISLILFVEGVELFSPAVRKARALIWAHECPLGVCFDSPHEQIWNPQGVEEVPCSLLLLAVILSQLKELLSVVVPWLKVDGESTLSLAATLVAISSSVVENS